MARSGKPWFNRERDWWNGRRVRLVEGKNDKATEKRARDKLADLRYEARHNPAADSDPTVASVIEAYMASASKRLAHSTQQTQFGFLQSFAEAHGWRRVRDAIPVHVEQWLDNHTGWVSDWTKNLAVRQVQTAFNWAQTKAKLIPSNPFKGFTIGRGRSVAT